MKYIFLLLISMSIPAFGDELFELRDGSYISIPIQIVSQIHVAKECADEKKKCFKSINRFKVENFSENMANANPAHHYCKLLAGSPRILYDKAYNQLSYCLFDNKYLVDAWDLLRARGSH